MQTIDYLNNEVKALTLQHTIADAKNLFAELIFTHIPIVENGIFYGLIAESDLFGYEYLDKKIEEIRYGLQVFFVSDDIVWLDLLKIFSLNEANIIPVLNSKNEYLGYFELADMLHYFSNTPFLQKLGNILIISKNEVDFSISEVAQIVESNDAKLYGVLVSGNDRDRVIVTVKLFSDNINDVIHTFRRYDYHIILGVNEDEYLNDLKQRSDYLHKYLNI